MKYTQGPWRNDWNNNGSICPKNDDSVIIVDQYWPESGWSVEDEAEQAANILLITKVPEMYEMLRHVAFNTKDEAVKNKVTALLDDITNNWREND